VTEDGAIVGFEALVHEISQRVRVPIRAAARQLLPPALQHAVGA
jgi:hypothetical protein